MNQYDARDSGCRIFMDFNSYGELIMAISDWFSGLAPETKTIRTIVFEEGDLGRTDAYVYYTTLSPEAERQLGELVSESNEIQVELRNESKN